MFKNIEQQIKEASGNCDELLKIISELENLTHLAENKLNVLMYRVDSGIPEIRELPNLPEYLNYINHISVPSVVIERTKHLLRAALFVLQDKMPKAVIDKNSPLSLQIEWLVPNQYMCWIIRPTFLKWPGISVEILEDELGQSAYVYYAPHLLEKLQKLVVL